MDIEGRICVIVMDIEGMSIDKIKHEIIHARIIRIFNDYPSCIIIIHPLILIIL